MTDHPIDAFDRRKVTCPTCELTYLSRVAEKWRICIFCNAPWPVPSDADSTVAPDRLAAGFLAGQSGLGPVRPSGAERRDGDARGQA
jgi:hypothetical protein